MVAQRPLSRRAKILLPVGLVVLVALSVHRLYIAEPPPTRVEIQGPTMGTTFHVLLDVPSLEQAERERLRGAITGVLDEVDRLMSTYDSTSELARFNRAEGTEPAPLSARTLEVLRASLEVARRSGGALDVTVGPLVDAWGFGPAPPPPSPPDSGEVARILQATGYDKIVLDLEAGTVARTHPGVTLDFSAVAKGYAADAVTDTLARLGYERVLVEVGGELRAGHPRADGGLWRIAIEEPDRSGRIVNRVLEVADVAVATSGDYRNVLEVDGVLHTHLVDPRTGRPARHRGASVTVVHPSAMMADAWATALAVLGLDEGMPVANREGLAALFITRDDEHFVARASEAFETRFGESNREDRP